MSRLVNLVDPTLDINAQAWAVMQALKRHGLEISLIKLPRTSAWYNGRERGICLDLRRDNPDTNKTEQLNIAFGEARNSDNIFVDAWISGYTFNPPTVSDFTDEAYINRRCFAYLDVKEAAKYIINKVQDFLNPDMTG